MPREPCTVPQAPWATPRCAISPPDVPPGQLSLGLGQPQPSRAGEVSEGHVGEGQRPVPQGHPDTHVPPSQVLPEPRGGLGTRWDPAKERGHLGSFAGTETQREATARRVGRAPCQLRSTPTLSRTGWRQDRPRPHSPRPWLATAPTSPAELTRSPGGPSGPGSPGDPRDPCWERAGAAQLGRPRPATAGLALGRSVCPVSLGALNLGSSSLDPAWACPYLCQPPPSLRVAVHGLPFCCLT